MPEVKPLNKTQQKKLDAYIKKRRRETSPEFEEKRRKDEEKKRKADFIKRALKAGFILSQAKFLFDNFSQSDHAHWDGRIGGN